MFVMLFDVFSKKNYLVEQWNMLQFIGFSGGVWLEVGLRGKQEVTDQLRATKHDDWSAIF